MKFLIIPLIFTTGLLSITCKKDEPTKFDCSNVVATYTLLVKPILDANCASSGCHNASSKKSGYDLSTYDATISKAKDKAFLGSIQHISGYSKMPENGNKLSDNDIKVLSCWVQNNMPL